MEYILESSDSMHCVQFDQRGSYTWKLKVNAQQPFLLENFVSMNFFKYEIFVSMKYLGAFL